MGEGIPFMDLSFPIPTLIADKPNAYSVKAIQDPQGRSMGRCVSPSISRQNIHPFSNGGFLHKKSQEEKSPALRRINSSSI